MAPIMPHGGTRTARSGVSAIDRGEGDDEGDDGVRRDDRETTRRAESDAVIPLYDSGLVTARARETVS
jgi:hypothetical protein